MQLLKILLFACLAVVIGNIQNASADGTPDYLSSVGNPMNLQVDTNRESNINSGFAWDWNASGNLDSRVSDLDKFDDLGNNVKVRDLGVSVDALYSIFAGRIALDDTYENSFKANANNIQEKVRDLYIGVQPMTNTLVLFGRMDIPFGSDVTQRDISINDPIHQLNISNERRVVATVQVTPQIIQDILGAKTSIEASAFNNDQNPNLRISDSQNMNSYALRVKSEIAKVLTQASYMTLSGGGHQADVSASVNIGPLRPYAEIRQVRGDAIYGNTNAGTVGVATGVLGGKLYVEGSHIQTKNSTFFNRGSQNSYSIGYDHRLNAYMNGGLEYTTNVAVPTYNPNVFANTKDKTVMATLSVHRKDTSSSNPGLFSALKPNQSGQ